MKKYFIAIFVVILINMATAQEAVQNRFEESEHSAAEYTEGKTDATAKGPVTAYGPGNPGEPVPVDDYIPLLLLTGVGIIFYTTYRKKQMTKS